MRITDEGGDEKDNYRGGAKPSIMDSIKAKSQVKSADDEGTTAQPWERATGTPAWEKGPQETEKITADVQSAKLKQLLGQIKQS